MAKTKNPLTKTIRLEIINECEACGNLYNYKTGTGTNSTTCRKCISFMKRADNKKRALDYLGGKCIKCGYNACTAVLCFHHFDGWTDGYFSEEEKTKYKKKFGIASRPEMSFEALKKELDKCVILCSNHHLELHSKLWSLKKEELNLKC